MTRVADYRRLRQGLRGRLMELPSYVDQVYTFPPSVDDATRKRIRETGYW